MTPARTWLILASSGQDERTEQTDERAAEADGGLSVYVDHIGLPEYLGVWLAPNGGYYHVYSDYPAEHHARFGFVAQTA
jgi:hypothetical protein